MGMRNPSYFIFVKNVAPSLKVSLLIYGEPVGELVRVDLYDGPLDGGFTR